MIIKKRLWKNLSNAEMYATILKNNVYTNSFSSKKLKKYIFI